MAALTVTTEQIDKFNEIVDQIRQVPKDLLKFLQSFPDLSILREAVESMHTAVAYKDMRSLEYEIPSVLHTSTHTSSVVNSIYAHDVVRVTEVYPNTGENINALKPTRAQTSTEIRDANALVNKYIGLLQKRYTETTDFKKFLGNEGDTAYVSLTFSFQVRSLTLVVHL